MKDNYNSEVVQDYYCENHSNPFRWGYAELWYAWRPVHTNRGWKWFTKVHRVMKHRTSQNLFTGESYISSIYFDYYEHKESTHER